MEEEEILQLSPSDAPSGLSLGEIQRTVRASDLAEMLGITTGDLARLARLGATFTGDNRGEWLLKESVAGYIARLKEKAAENPRDRLFRAKADVEEIRAEKELGTLIEADKARAAFTDIIARARRQLEAIPPRVAPQLAETSVPATVEKILNKEIQTILECIAKGNPQNEK